MHGVDGLGENAFDAEFGDVLGHEVSTAWRDEPDGRVIVVMLSQRVADGKGLEFLEVHAKQDEVGVRSQGQSNGIGAVIGGDDVSRGASFEDVLRRSNQPVWPMGQQDG